VVANELEIMDGKLTGKVIGDIVDAQYKANTLNRLAEKYEIPPRRPWPSAMAPTICR
jgi:phosphoserine phosphatase